MQIFAYCVGALCFIIWEYTRTLSRLGRSSQERYARYVLTLWMDWYLGVQIGVHVYDTPDSGGFGDSGAQGDSLILCSNHINLLDTFIIQRMCREVFPEYHVAFVHGESATKIPFLSRFLRQYHVHIDDLKSGVISEELDLIPKKIFVLFPEARLYHPQSLGKSRKYCETSNIDGFNHVLCPYSKGFEILRKYVSPDQLDVPVIDATITYPWYHEHDYRFITVWDTIRHSFPTQNRVVNIYLRNVTCSGIMDLWRDKDVLLGEIRENQFRTNHSCNMTIMCRKDIQQRCRIVRNVARHPSAGIAAAIAILFGVFLLSSRSTNSFPMASVKKLLNLAA